MTMARFSTFASMLVAVLFCAGKPAAAAPCGGAQGVSFDSARIKPAGLVIPFLKTGDYEKKADYRGHIDSLVDVGVCGFLVRVEDPELTRRVTEKLQRRANGNLLFCADLETGTFYQTNADFNLLSLMAWAAVNDTDAIYRYAATVAKLCLYTGIRLNLAPVVDVNNDPSNSVIAQRSFGDDPAKVARFAAVYARAMLNYGVAPVYKHFPGHGSTETDSHYDLPVIKKNFAQLSRLELVPYSDAVKNNIPCVMMGHLSLPAIDPNGIASSLSPTLCRGLLRDSLGFSGVIITDGLEMRAVSSRFSDSAVVVNACLAGNDILLGPGDPFAVISNLSASVTNGIVPERNIIESLDRIARLKNSLKAGSPKLRLTYESLLADFKSIATELCNRAPSVTRDPSALLSKGKINREGLKILILFDGSNEKQADECLSLLRKELGGIPVEKLNVQESGRSVAELYPEMTSKSTILVHLLLKSGSTIAASVHGSTVKDIINQLGLLPNCIAVSYRDPYAPVYLPNNVTAINAFGYNKLYPYAISKKLLSGEAFNGTNPLVMKPAVAYRSVSEHEIIDQRFTKVSELINTAIAEQVFPGAQVEIAQNGEVLFRRSYGNFTYDSLSPKVTNQTKYDLASVSKVIATTTAAMLLYDRGALRLDAPVAEYIPEFAASGKSGILISNLLLHNSGLPAFKPFYKTLHTPSEVFADICATEPAYRTGEKTVYSDLGMITLGKVIEKISGLSLDEFCTENIFKPLGMHNTGYSPAPEEKNNCAPTEYDSLWRKRLIQGEVHDEASALLGGVAGHAGLFSTAADVGILLSVLYNNGRFGEEQFIQKSTVKLFTKKAGEQSTRALGWDTKSDSGSSAGTIMGPRSFGHTGFTGTSVWVDPGNGCYVVLLTNRVHPTRKNTQIIGFRPKFHDTILRILQGE